MERVRARFFYFTAAVVAVVAVVACAFGHRLECAVALIAADRILREALG